MGDSLLYNALQKLTCLDEEHANVLTIEEAAVLQLFVQTRKSGEDGLSQSERDLLCKAQSILTSWQHLPMLEGGGGREKRKQLVLRAAIDKLKHGAPGEISTSEVELVRAAQIVLANRKDETPGKARLLGLIQGLMRSYDAASQNRQDAASVPRHPAAEPADSPESPEASAGAALTPEEPPAPPESPEAGTVRQHTVNKLLADEYFTKKKRHTVRSLDGIDAELIAQTFEIRGDTEIEGDIPEDTLLVVRDGNLRVDGTVLGHLVATGNIAIDGNISSVHAVSSKGSIQVQKALANAQIVAKAGSVETERLENPSRVFAWCDVRVNGDVVGGRLFGRSIDIKGKAIGAELHAVDKISAYGFEPGSKTTTVLCMRDTITSEDFGMPIGEEDYKLRQGIGKYQYEVGIKTRMIRYATRDTEDAQRSILYYLLGGKENPRTVREMRGCQCQANFLRQIIDAGDRFTGFVGEWIESKKERNDIECASVSREVADTLKPVLDDVELMANSFALSHKGVIVTACKELIKAAKSLREAQTPKAQLKAACEQIARNRSRWQELHDRLGREVATLADSFGVSPQVVQQIEAHPEELETAVGKLIKKIASESKDGQFDRTKAALIRLFQASIDRDRKNVTTWSTERAKAQEQLTYVKTRLEENSVVLFTSEELDGPLVQGGGFEKGVILVANPASNSPPLETGKARVKVGDPIHGSARFVYQNSKIIREA